VYHRLLFLAERQTFRSTDFTWGVPLVSTIVDCLHPGTLGSLIIFRSWFARLGRRGSNCTWIYLPTNTCVSTFTWYRTFGSFCTQSRFWHSYFQVQDIS